MPKGQFFTSGQIEQRALAMIARYEQRYGEILSPPVPIERLIEHLLDLRIVWTTIPNEKDSMALGGLAPSTQTIVLNEAHLDLLDGTPGLENFTIAHEVGHWDLHFDQVVAEGQTVLPGFEHPLEVICRAGDGSWDEINADRYASYLLMPKKLILRAVKSKNITNWKTLYGLRDDFKVSISALTNRLKGLNRLHIDSDGNLYSSKEQYCGQASLWR